MELRIGTKVHYDDGFTKENGVIKSHHPTDLSVVYVVYKCNNDWENFHNYTAQSTKIKNLKEGWI